MEDHYWNDMNWAWFLFFGIWVTFAVGVGTKGFVYQAQRKYGDTQRKKALDNLNARFARLEINRGEYNRLKSKILQRFAEKPSTRDLPASKKSA